MFSSDAPRLEALPLKTVNPRQSQVRGTDTNGLVIATLTLAGATIMLLLVAFVAAAGFAVLAQRRLRHLGMLAALGAAPGQVRIAVTATGVVVGATQYEHGRDIAPAVTGVRELLDDACAVIPALGEYELAECAAGLRPMTPDNLPIVGRLDDRVLAAAGHGRSGFLLAPWTAERVAAELDALVEVA